DRSPIKKIEWALNSPGLKSSDTAAKNYRVVTETPMVKEGKYIIRIPDDGYRYGILTITDSTDQKAIINVEIAYDRTNPTTPNGGNIGGVSGSNSTAYTQNASGSNDTISGLKQYLYCIKNNNTAPNKEDSCFKGSNSFTRSCGKTYHAYTIAVDNAGNKSEVRDMGQTSDAADSWSGWSNCSKPCGGGRQTRSNSCALKGVQTRTCNNNPCTPPIPDAYKGTCNLVGQTQYLIRGGWYSPQCGNQTWAYIHYCADANGNLSASTLTFRLSNYNMAGVSQTSIINDTAFGCPRPPLNWYKIGSKNDGY
ncbi:MAG: thrombospondin type-1 domain-containing protein, partial [Bacilli bacterium]|nr:thrombospondin type-1 domain-containing protein [Bacilli bacterium]